MIFCDFGRISNRFTRSRHAGNSVVYFSLQRFTRSCHVGNNVVVYALFLFSGSPVTRSCHVGNSVVYSLFLFSGLPAHAMLETCCLLFVSSALSLVAERKPVKKVALKKSAAAKQPAGGRVSKKPAARRCSSAVCNCKRCVSPTHPDTSRRIPTFFWKISSTIIFQRRVPLMRATSSVYVPWCLL